MNWWCTGGVLVVYWWCTGGVLMVYWWCTGGVLMVYWYFELDQFTHLTKPLLFYGTLLHRNL